MTQIAYLGTGLLGSGFAEAAANRGDSVTVWNRTESKARALERFGVRVATTPADAVREAEHVHLVLKDDAVVDEVIAALRPGLRHDATVIDHTTTQPELTAARVGRLASEGVRYIHCPVFIGPAAARAGKGTILSSGDRALFDAVRPELARMAPRVEYLGERPDLAAVYKLCGNAFIIGVTAMLGDVFAISGSSGLAPMEALRLFEFFDPTGTISGRGRSMAQGDFTPSFELMMARKDVRLMIETADSRPLTVLPAIAERMDELIADGRGAEDVGVIAAEGMAPTAGSRG
jgi:3-hydroxyisobutyrate dehydrogenase